VERLELAGVEIQALSVGGLETCIHLPRWRIAFDIGRCPAEVIDCPTVLFTHAHMDHMGGAPYHTATRALRRQRPPTYVVPRTNHEDFERLFEAWRALDRSDMEHVSVPLAPGEEYVLANQKIVRPFRSPHAAPCQGYSVWGRREKLRPEHAGKEGSELARLRRQGVKLTDVVETPELAFTGDTLVDVLEREEVVRRSRVLIMECTFIDDRVSVEQSRSKGHVHLYELAERAELFANEAVLLTHFSARYSARAILSALDQHLPPPLRSRVTPLLGAHR